MRLEDALRRRRGDGGCVERYFEAAEVRTVGRKGVQANERAFVAGRVIIAQETQLLEMWPGARHIGYRRIVEVESFGHVDCQEGEVAETEQWLERDRGMYDCAVREIKDTQIQRAK